MPSIIPGFEYDIFISYRQKDNKGDHWVTEFVSALKTELEATFKEDISIYFDTNPHDGLLETHNVDKSLEGKLKCLIFIPIISQTYCDTKSFAWQHEFCAFNKLAKEDKFGRDIKLSNGNVASRILPIKIHDLDDEDKTLLENELGGVLRAIEFIFKSPGVNRPLRANEEHPQDNVNKTFYRDQVNKVANAVKEIITSLKKPTPSFTTGKGQSASSASDLKAGKLSNSAKKKLTIVAAIVLLFSVAGYFVIPKMLPAQPVDLGNSIAVLYFDNISSDPEQEYFSDGITEEIIAHLSSIKGLHVTSRTSVIQFKGKGKTTNLKDIARQLNVANILEGSVRKSGDKLRITAQLIDAETDRHVWSEVFDRDLTDVFKIQSEIAQSIASKFKIAVSSQAKAIINAAPTKNIKAYELYLKARSIPWGTGAGIGSYYGGLFKAIRLLKEAIALDPDYAQPYVLLSRMHRFIVTAHMYNNLENYDSAKFFAKEAILRDPNSAEGYLALAETMAYAQELSEAIKWFYKACELDSATALLGAADLFKQGGDMRTAIKIYSHLIKMNPLRVEPYLGKAEAYRNLSQADSLEKYASIVERLAPNNHTLYGVLLWFAQSNRQIDETKALAKKYFEDDTLSYNKDVGIAYLFAKKWKEAERYYARTHYRDMDWGLVLLKTGKRDSGLAVLRRVAPLREANRDWVNASRVHAALGDKKKAIESLQKITSTYLFFLRNDPFLDFIRQEPEFKKWESKMEKRNAGIMQQIKDDEKKKFSLDF